MGNAPAAGPVLKAYVLLMLSVWSTIMLSEVMNVVVVVAVLMSAPREQFKFRLTRNIS
jgi:hypothetical protein